MDIHLQGLDCLERQKAELQRREETQAADVEEMTWKSEYYALLREGKYEEAEALLRSKS